MTFHSTKTVADRVMSVTFQLHFYHCWLRKTGSIGDVAATLQAAAAAPAEHRKEVHGLQPNKIRHVNSLEPDKDIAAFTPTLRLPIFS